MSTETKQQILDAAERVFAEVGIQAAPLRRIIAEAGVNAAAIHYHFGSKDELVRAVFARRFDTLNRERIRLLDEVERQAGNGSLAIEDVLTAFVAPAMRTGRETGAGSQFRQLGGRIFSEKCYMAVIFNDVFHETERRFDAACRRALPSLPQKERIWRKHLAIGVMIHMLIAPDLIHELSGGVCDLSNVDGAIRRIVAFMAAGMKASVGSVSRKKPRSVPEARRIRTKWKTSGKSAR